MLIEAASRLRASTSRTPGRHCRNGARRTPVAPEHIGRSGSPARLLGFVDEADLPALYGCADAFVMLCRQRWGGLEQEGFGIVFVEAAAAGCPQIAGRSGGSAEAVADGETGYVIEIPTDVRRRFCSHRPRDLEP